MQEKPKKGLGRGLDALIPHSEMTFKKVIEIDISSLTPSKNQPRKTISEESIEELVKSIQQHGILQPILARSLGNGMYEIIAGERRWRAAQKAGLTKVPIMVKEIEDVKAIEIALVENIQREDLNPIEVAKAYKTLIEEFDLTQEELSLRVGKERATIANTLRLLTLPDIIQNGVSKNLISIGHAKAILSAKGKDLQEKIFLEVVKRGLSVRETESLVKKLESPKKEKKTKIDPNTKAAEEEMKKKIGLTVSIRRKGMGGMVAIFFKNEEELNHIYDYICFFVGRKK